MPPPPVCGGQTHTLVRQGIDELLPGGIRMIHGPGCPVCVTPLEIIDKALLIARRPDVIFTSFGDMLRVPGSVATLDQLRADGADVLLAAMRSQPEGRDAVRVGTAISDHPGRVTMRTPLGAHRIVDVLVGEQLPRIC